MSYITCFTAITISNKKLFNYKVVDLVASYNFRIYFFLFEVIWKFWKFDIQNLNYIFGCQNNLNWKDFELQSYISGWGLQLLYRPIFDLTQFEFFKNRMFKSDALWCCTSPMSSQRWRALMLPVTFYLSKSVTHTNLIGDGPHGPAPIIKVTCFDVARHQCHNKGDGQCFRETIKRWKVTCIIFARHPDNKGDVQWQHVTFVHVTIGHFLHSGV